MDQLQKHYSGGVLTLVSRNWPVFTKLWMTDLSEITTLLRDSYGDKGPVPRDPASMMRSYLLLLLTHPTMGVTEWGDMLYKLPLYAILSGFKPVNIPGTGTSYNFFNRLWAREKRKETKKKK